MPISSSDNLLVYLENQGPTPSSSIVETLGISRATLSRRVKELSGSVVTIGKGRATMVAARCSDVDESIPLYQVTETGKVVLFGSLIPLRDGERIQWYHNCENPSPSLQTGEFKNGLYPGWPWFLDDLRPAGFLGRAFGKRMSEIFQIDKNPEAWSDLELVKTLLGFGWNLQGNFLLGNGQAYEVFQQKKIDGLEGDFKHENPKDYPELASLALAEDEIFGSSAGGEQPKFTTMLTEGSQKEFRAVIVKFSPKLDTTVGQRWADLLNAERIANQILKDAGFAVANTRILKMENRVFLESERFDRIGLFGRKGLVSLRSLDAAFVGVGSGTWAKCARKLFTQKMITETDLDQIIGLQCFGELIGNTDMHFGNLSFFLGEEFPLKLAPVYDMLPMRFRPSSTGEIVERAFKPTLPKPEDQSVWLEVYPLAQKYWQEVASHAEISSGFQQIAKQATESLELVHRVTEV